MWSEAMSSLAKMYPKLSAVELSAILMKGAAMSASLERDSGFNSGSSEHEDDLKSLDQSSRDGLISPENSSEDSVEVKLLSSSPSATVTTATTTTSATPPSLLSAPQSVAVALVKNKRKSSEPLRVVAETELLAPLKKRIRYDHTKHHQDEAQAPVRQTTQDDDERGEVEVDEERSVSRTATSPFRPWAPEAGHTTTGGPSVAASFPHPADLLVRHPAVTTLHRPPFSTSPLDQQQPLALVAKKSTTNGVEQSNGIASPPVSSRAFQSPARRISECTSHSEEDGSEMALQRKLQLLHHQHQQQQQQHHHHPSHHPLEEFVAPHAPPSIDDGRSNDSMTDHEQQQHQLQQHGHAKGHSSSSSSSAIHSRNYKNMTRERRIEANARERTRVHTISAAYEKLRRAIPAYSNAQKLSKLSILRIACSYILTLSRMAGEDYSEDASEPSIADCVAMVTQTIQTEGKIRKKKDE